MSETKAIEICKNGHEVRACKKRRMNKIRRIFYLLKMVMQLENFDYLKFHSRKLAFSMLQNK